MTSNITLIIPATLTQARAAVRGRFVAALPNMEIKSKIIPPKPSNDSTINKIFFAAEFFILSFSFGVCDGLMIDPATPGLNDAACLKSPYLRDVTHLVSLKNKEK